MYNPGATYRIQFHKEFTFAQFEQAIPYLQKLGVQTIYASPVFAATPGSTHGYDGIDPHRINPEIGTEEQLRQLSSRLKENGIGWLQDVVPNHMAFHPQNQWLMDVLEQGKASPYAPFFDILWSEDERIMVPFLGSALKEVIDMKELKIIAKEDQLFFDYFDSHYPLNEAAHKAVSWGTEQAKSPEEISGDATLMQQLADMQYYRLCHWQETDRHINYRRFFTVNGLICLNIQDQQVFEHYHQFIKQLLSDGVISGLRIDHIDGLYDPTAYLQRLQEFAGKETYTVVEKILEPGEALPEHWAVHGNTGYDFLSLSNNLFTNQSAARTFTTFYQQLVKDDTSIHQQLYNKKAHILYQHMHGELENLYQLFITSGLAKDELPADALKSAIGELLIQCPVYRYYGNSFPLAKEETAALQDMIARIRKDKPELNQALNNLTYALLEKPLEGDHSYNQKALHFYQRCMQFTGPLMAKGVEDTLMYTYNRFIGHNDVGDSPESFGISKEAFHKAMLDRQEQWPLSINATSTHDTKRGEDVRARLNVLTDLPNEWIKAVKEWRQLNANLRQNGMPDANDEYLIYQTITGAYPFEEEAGFEDRICEYLTKALREAKTHSDWAKPDEAYEAATINFARQLLNRENPFWASFTAFHKKVADFGIINSLAQLLLKFTCPGIPDTYQGTELWDLSLVDPDNRRLVDYQLRLQLLESLPNEEDIVQQIEELWADRHTAKIKLWLTHRLLQERKLHKELFAEGRYVPLRTEGKYKDHVFAFARHSGKEWIVVALPLHLAELCKKQDCDPLSIDWKNTTITLRPEAPAEWKSLLDDTHGKQESKLNVQDLFKKLPFAFLKLQHPETTRSAGILMSITSLPSPYGIGDFGPEAKAFARFLSRSNQGYWQLLPTNPLCADSNYSPYSSVSTMAGNTLLISPDLLVKEGLLDEHTAQQHQLPQHKKLDYATVEEHKKALLDAAYQTYQLGDFPKLKQAFHSFKAKEKHWLADYALYVALRHAYNDKPWYEWPEAVKKRDQETLNRLTEEHGELIEKTKWLQFMFSKQWSALRKFCNQLGIKLFGDLPFYASFDSADVWTHPELFSVNPDGKMTGIAGVPPDYFSETGQLWGMPTFNWNNLKKQDYAWWIARLRKNLELYDVLRIDHFRALAAYWEVPDGEETAVNGQWIKGPGTHFFDRVREAFGGLPFIAEDLGYEMDDVYELRDEVGLPGMKVLQFAFDENLQQSVDIPHNYGENFIAYTGTHDNNTTLGWYREEAKPTDKKRLEHYAGCKVNEQNVTEVMIRLAYASVARMAIIPLQDVLKLDEHARMNIPSSADDNWSWRLQKDQVTEEREAWLRSLTRFYNRI